MIAFCGCCGRTGCVYAQADCDEAERLTKERDQARALLAAVADLGDVEHDPDGDCRGNWDDEPCDKDCGIADHNALMGRVRLAVTAWQANSSTEGGRT